MKQLGKFLLCWALGLPENGKITVFTDLLSTGYADGTFGPTKTITREEALTMIARTMRFVLIRVGFSILEIMNIIRGSIKVQEINHTR